MATESTDGSKTFAELIPKDALLAHETELKWEIREPQISYSSVKEFNLCNVLNGKYHAIMVLRRDKCNLDDKYLEAAFYLKEVDPNGQGKTQFWLSTSAIFHFSGYQEVPLVDPVKPDFGTLKSTGELKLMNRHTYSDEGRDQKLSLHTHVKIFYRTLQDVNKRVQERSFSHFQYQNHHKRREGNESSQTISDRYARSPVFKKMFTADMTEAKSGVIKMDDVSFKALKFLLNFLYTNQFLPFMVNEEDPDKPCISELLYLANKYSIQELLDYFDDSITYICEEGNVAFLLNQVNLYSLKKAMIDIGKFVKGNDSALLSILEEFRL